MRGASNRTPGFRPFGRRAWRRGVVESVGGGASVTTDAVLREVEALRDEVAEFTAELIRVPSVNPPGEEYEACARLLGERYRAFGRVLHFP